MRLHGLIVAAVVLLVLTGTLYWSNHHKPAGSPETPAASAPKILTLNEADVSKIEIQKKDAAELAIAREGAGKWQILLPKPLPADQGAVSEMLSTLSALNSERLVEDKPSDLAPYGLNPPKLEVVVSEKNNQTQKLLVGDDTPASSSTYAKLDGDPRVFTIASYTKGNLDKSLYDLRDKRLLPVEADKISRVELLTTQQDIEFGRDKEQWQILKPRPLRADGSQVDDLVRKLTGAQMQIASDADTKKAASAFATASPVATAKVTTDSGTQQLQVRKQKDDYYAKSSAVDGVYKVASDLGQGLDKKLDDFRNKKLFDFGYTDPDKIEVHDGLSVQFLTKGGADWWSGDGKKLDPASADSLLGKIRDLAASKFVDSGFTTPLLTISVRPSGGTGVEKVVISKADSGYIAKRENDASFYLLENTAVEDLQKAAAGLKPASAK